MEAVEASPLEEIYHCFAQVGGSQSSKTEVQPEGQCSKEVEVEEEAWHSTAQQLRYQDISSTLAFHGLRINLNAA